MDFYVYLPKVGYTLAFSITVKVINDGRITLPPDIRELENIREEIM